LSLISLDIDHFKRINDEHGHAAGDVTLAALGDLLARHVRPFDTVGRLGGEEFGIILADCPAEQVLERAQALVTTIRRESAGWDVPITVSAGVATIPDHAADPDRLGIAADRALYRAKAGGRDRVGAAVRS
jgi:diguanylate cyclase (GGDEF)-like protein